MRIVSDDDYDDDEITLSDCDPDEPSEFSHQETARVMDVIRHTGKQITHGSPANHSPCLKTGHFFGEKIMYELQNWYPFIEAMLVLVAAFIVITLDIMNNDAKLRKEQKAMRHRDKLHYAMMQSRGVM